MRILLTMSDLYTNVGGGQSYFSELARNSPQHEFFFFANDQIDPSIMPSNLHSFQVGSLYRNHLESVQFGSAWASLAGHSLHGKEYEFLYMLDLAASTHRASFDIVEIPDFLAFGAFFPSAIRHLGGVVGKSVLSMHGTLSDALTNNWASEMDEGALDLLSLTEKLLYKSVDIRYAISVPYKDQWQAQVNLPSFLFDLGLVFKLSAFGASRVRQPASTVSIQTKPTLTFIGRQEKWKGPDLFVDLVAGLAKDTYAGAQFVGPVVTIGGSNSWDAIRAMADRRGLDVEHRVLSRSKLLEDLASSRWIVVVPSRHDTLNLAAMDALFSGVPTMISRNAGICQYLDEVLPGLPYIKFDPDDLTVARRQLGDLITHYDRERERLQAFLASAAPKSRGLPIDAIYAECPQFDAAARAEIESVFAVVATHIEGALAARMWDQLIGGLQTNVASMFPGKEQVFRDLVVPLLGQAREFGTIASEARATAERQGFLFDDQMHALQTRLAPNCYCGNRVPVYKLMADLELQRGNDLLYATYHLRCMRLTNQADGVTLERVCKILEEKNFKEEADVARLLFKGSYDFDGSLLYLGNMQKRFKTPPSGDVAIKKDTRTLAAPKLSIIVSLYNAAEKLPTFLRSIRSLTQSTRDVMELVLVDSFSPDNTTEVVAACLDALKAEGFAISTVYMRTSVRETIQRAWNRGIDLARGSYLSFLGVDEMNRADAFDIMIKYLDDNPAVDWVQGTALVTETNMSGSFVRDIMLYDRRFDNDFMNLLDTCYLGYVGALYRKTIHDRVGFYDDRFKAAGDSEFKNRALPYITARTLPDCLGYFLNYPDERTTQSPTAEIEDLRAWYLHRTPAGIAYGWRDRGRDDLVSLFYRCLNYRKTYLPGPLTDIELACAAGEYMRMEQPDLYKDVFTCAIGIAAVRDIYRTIDSFGELQNGVRGAPFLSEASSMIERSFFALSTVAGMFKYIKTPTSFTFTNDNRSHQHSWLWPSQSRQVLIEARGDYADLAGPQDFAELFSACGSRDSWVDFESAWHTNCLDQVKALFQETSLDIAIVSEGSDLRGMMRAVAAARPTGSKSMTFLSYTPSAIAPFKLPRVYGLGPVTTDRPVLAAAHLVVILHNKAAPWISAYHLMRVLGFGKAIVTTKEVLVNAGKALPDIDFSALKAVENEADILGEAMRLSVDEPALSQRRQAAQKIGMALHQHPRTRSLLRDGAPAGRDNLRVEPIETKAALDASRHIRNIYEAGGAQAVRQETSGTLAGLEPHRTIVRALFETKRSASLRTSQPIFQRIAAEPPLEVGA